MAPQALEQSSTADLVADAAIPSLVSSAAAKESRAADGNGGKAPEETWLANGIFVIATHVVALAALVFYRPAAATVSITMILVWLSMIGITAGYHRLWSHRGYSAHIALRVFLGICGTAAFQGSIKWWVLRHRLHHRFTDTEDDPYSSKKGLFFSHIGWIFVKPHYPKIRLIDASDLVADPVVVFQHKYYVQSALFLGFVLPAAICSIWGDAWGGMLYGGCVSRVFIWHATFCINSIAHWLGDRVYSTQISARGNLLCAILTNGEGYHNFHHAFPKDYRNGINWYDWDPTKWCIMAWNLLGLATDLFEHSDSDIAKAKLLVQEQAIKDQKSQLNWGPEPSELPAMTMEEFKTQREGRPWIIIDGLVLDLEPFLGKHPGGDKILKAYYGKDASAAFNGGLNQHTEAARNSARMYRIATIQQS